MSRYGKKAQAKVRETMRERKRGTLKSARRAGAKVPAKKHRTRR